MHQIGDAPTDLGANDFVMSKNMAEKLHQHFPNHLWAVTCEGKQGIATIRNLGLSGKYGFVLHLSRLNNDPGMKCVLRAGGEILERFAIARRLRPGDVRGAIDQLEQMPDGAPIFDPTNAKSKVEHLVKKAWDKSRSRSIANEPLPHDPAAPAVPTAAELVSQVIKRVIVENVVKQERS